MIKELLKPLEWQGKKPAEGESYRALAVSPVTRYVITDDGRKVKVIYHNFTEDEPAKTKPGFSSVAEAKDWVQGEHYPRKMSKWLNPDPLTDTVSWFKVAKPEPTDKDKTTQLACVFEEVAELAFAVGLSSAGDKLLAVSYELKTLSHEQAELFVEKVNNIETLDATTDTKVTLVGFEYMMGYNGNGALTEVNASNWSKFENGKAVTDENGKIIKGEGYFKPELDKFVGSHVIEEVITGGIKLTVTKNSDGSVHFKSCVEGDYE